MSSLKIRKIGNSLGVILPKEVQDALNVTNGDKIDIEVTKSGKVIIGQFLSHHTNWKFSNPKLSKEDSKWINAELEDEKDIPRW